MSVDYNIWNLRVVLQSAPMEQGFFSQGAFESTSLRIHNIFAVQVFQFIIVAYTLRFGLYKTQVIF